MPEDLSGIRTNDLQDEKNALDRIIKDPNTSRATKRDKGQRRAIVVAELDKRNARKRK